MSVYVQVSRTPASQNHPRAPTTGVREAPGHEIAGRKGLGFGAVIYGDLRRASVCFREVGTTDAPPFDGLFVGSNSIHRCEFDHGQPLQNPDMRGGDSDCRCRTQCVQEIGRKRAKIIVKYDDAQSLPRGKDVTLPEGYERDFKACRRFLDEHAL